jgi:predicted AlkP superfamily phosphohydrolase/phosphomutase
VLVSLDGAAAPVIDDAVRRGRMPNLGRLRARGATAVGSLTALPAKTPSGHAAVFTGAWSDRNGIGGIEVPVPGANVLTARSGYTSEMLRAEPLWVSAARQGLDVTVVSATQAFPFAPFLEERRFGGNYAWRLSLFDGYQGRQTAPAVITGRDVTLRAAAGWRGLLPQHAGARLDFDLSVAGSRLEALLFDDPSDPSQGFDSLYLAPEKRAGGVVLKPDPPGTTADGFRALTVRTAAGQLGLHFRLFSLRPDGSDFLLYVAEGALIRSNRPGLEAVALAASGGFVGNGASTLYKDGAFGPPLWNGGSGLAEARYLETALLVERQFRRLTDFGLQRTRWDVLIGYLPFPDEQLHLWLGYLEPALPDHDPALAVKLRPFVDQALGIADSFVGHLAEKLEEDVILAIASDHGQIPASRSVAFNVALERAGLLARTPAGEVDLFRTRAVYFPGNAGYFLVNRVGRREGIVAPDQEPAVLAELRAVLQAIRDPETGQPVVSAILDPRDSQEPSIGGPTGGDLYVSLASGYDASSSLDGALIRAHPPTGEHLFSPELPGMLATFVVAGPGVAKGADLGRIRQIDIAPTLAALLGIDPPAHSQGRILASALERRGPPVAQR